MTPQAHASVALIVKHFPGGLDALAEMLDKPRETLRKELSDDPKFKLGLSTAIRISDEAIALKSLHCYAFVNAIAGAAGRLIELPVRDMAGKQDLRDDAAGLVKEGTDVLIELNAALADDNINDNELARIEREALEVFERTQQVIRGARARHAAGKPAHLRAA